MKINKQKLVTCIFFISLGTGCSSSHFYDPHICSGNDCKTMDGRIVKKPTDTLFKKKKPVNDEVRQEKRTQRQKIMLGEPLDLDDKTLSIGATISWL